MCNRCGVPPRPVFRWLPLPLGLLAVALAAQAAAGAQSARITVRAGLLGCVKVGRWVPIRVAVDSENVQSVAVEAVDPHGNAVRFPLGKRPSPTAAGGPVRFDGLFQIGRLGAIPRVSVEFADGRVEQRRLRTADTGSGSAELVGPLRQSVVLVATLGGPAGFKSLGNSGLDGGRVAAKSAARKDVDRVRLLEYEDAGLLPSDVRGFDALDVLVISGAYPLTAAQDAAVQQWVREGGHLVVCRGSLLPPVGAAAKGSPPPSGDGLLARWLPVTLLGPDWLRDLNGLESFAGRKSPIIFGGRIRSVRIEDPQTRRQRAGIVLARSRTGPLIVRVACGFGQVTFCGLDFHEPPVSTWRDVDAVGEKILEQTMDTIRSRELPGRAQLAQSGISDLGTQLHAILENFPSVQRMTAIRTIGLLIVYILLIGPLDYVLVHRVLKRPRLTWATFPLMVSAATYLSVRSAEERNGNELQLNQVALLDVDATHAGPSAANTAAQAVHGFSWFTAYSSDSMRFDVRVRPDEVAERAGPPAHRPAPRPSVCWSGVNETVYGGMYRSGGLAIGQLGYTISAEGGAIERLPIPIWSTKTFKAEWRDAVPGLIVSRLTLADDGRLTGSIKHRFAAPIEDWILVHRGVLYRQAGSDAGSAGGGGSIPPNVDYRLSNAAIQQSGLMDHLTGARFRKEGTDKDRMRTTRFEQEAYDPAGRNALSFLRTVTFYQAIGGRKYTGLNNASLERLDLSGLLALNRAVLVGRLRGPAARVALSADDAGHPRNVGPRRSDTFVRILLSVKQGTEGG